MIIPADKRQSMVNMKREDYVLNVSTLLDDKESYDILSSDPVTSIANSTNKLLDKLWH